MTVLLWFQHDLRLADNPALAAALAAKRPIVPVFIFAPDDEKPWAHGGAARWWLHHSLTALEGELRRCASRLILRRGDRALPILKELIEATGATHVFWNRRYEPALVVRDQEVKAKLRALGITAEHFNAALLHEPSEVRTKTGSPYQVFTPFWKRCLAQPDPPTPQKAPRKLSAPKRWPASVRLAQFALLPSIDWAKGFQGLWTPGAKGAHARLERFLRDTRNRGAKIERYDSARDQPGEDGTSGLSPHLHFGEIGPREVWHRVRTHALARGEHSSWRQSRYLTEIGWREFAHHVLFHFPRTQGHALRARYERFPWKHSKQHLRAWQHGLTGYPIVDAGMRQLWQTGWMHNRVRMIVASFLVKDLLLAWQSGAAWFWDTLVDADLANNTLNWQWNAGCGADAAPYFRIFNPVTQGKKFDASGAYVRRWVPELAKLETRWLHEPWEAPEQNLTKVNIKLGVSYPKPIVSHDAARLAALAALRSLK